MSPLACSSCALFRQLARGLRTFLVHPAVVCCSRASWRAVMTAPHRAHTRPGACASLSSGLRYSELPILEVALLHHPLGRVLAVLRQDTLRLLAHALDCCPVSISSPYSGVMVIVPFCGSAIAGRSLPPESDTALTTCPSA